MLRFSLVVLVGCHTPSLEDDCEPDPGTELCPIHHCAQGCEAPSLMQQCCRESFEEISAEYALCAAQAEGLSPGMLECSSNMVGGVWTVRNILVTPCESPGHYAGDVTLVDPESGEILATGSYVGQSIYTCEDVR